MSGWNFADVWEVAADRVPDAPALRHGDRVIRWGELDRRADGVAAGLLGAGAGHQDKVALYLHNGPAYLEACFAAWKAGLVPFNTNYRYVADELVYLWDNADAVAVVFGATFTETVESLRSRLPRVTTWLWVDDGTGSTCPDWAVPYESWADRAVEPGAGRGARSGDDLLMLYTGGTTGLPKGVMWRQDDLFRTLNAPSTPNYGPEADLDRVRELLVAPGLTYLPACPLMHGTGWFTALMTLSVGGQVVTLTGPSFDPIEFLDTVEARSVNACAIVGDAFAKPILAALDAEPERWDLSSLLVMVSSGVMWSRPVKEGLLGHLPGLILQDAFSSSEALGMGTATTAAGDDAPTARFTAGEHTVVLTEDGRRVEPGSGEAGRVAVGGAVPVGYYKDPEKSAATFIEFEGRRYSMPGDWATVEADGSLTLLGRGSVCINTGGEKVFPEEVEEALKLHPTVRDAVAVGVPDDRFGEAVTGVVQPADGATVDPDALVDHVKARLAHYKAPRHVVVVESLGRAPNGKVDYQRWKDVAAREVADSH